MVEISLRKFTIYLLAERACISNNLYKKLCTTKKCGINYFYNDLKYTFVTFGRLPLSSIPKIMLHEEKSFILHSMTKNNQYAWVLVVALQDKQKEVQEQRICSRMLQRGN